MPDRKVYHVTKDTDGWQVKAEGADRATARTSSKEQAVAKATELAKAAELGQLIIHREDGSIEKEHTYGKDPERHPG